jgi:hypothetical protein
MTQPVITPPMSAITQNDVVRLRKWSTALRSGEYLQYTNGDLANDTLTAFCCLGVERVISGCEIVPNGKYGRCRWVDRTRRIQGSEYDIRLEYENLFDWLRNNFILCDYSPEFRVATSLFITLNDDYRLTFSQIADVIDYVVDHSPITE